MRILFAAGGTAGHINPAIAVAQYLCNKNPNTECLFAAVPGGMEQILVRDAGYQTTDIMIKGLRRSFSLESIRRILMVPRAIKQAKEIIRTFTPDVVFATGGYLSFPIIWAASRMKIPCFLHESNAVPGIAVKLLAKRADAVLLNIPTAAQFLPASCTTYHVGNPLRAEFQIASRAHARRMLGINDSTYMILSFGGSLGAKKLNDTCIRAYKTIREKIPSFIWHHATGKDKYEEVLCMAQENGIAENMHIHPYLTEMALYMGAADVVISRAGAVTLTELSAFGKAAILVPYPAAAGNHQVKNALEYQKSDAAIVIREDQLNEVCLANHILEMWKYPQRRKKLEEKIKHFYSPDAPQKISEFLENLN